MALNYGDNYVLKIKKGLVEYTIQDAVAKAAIEVIQGDASTEGSIAKAEADAKAYAAGLASNYDASGAASTAKSEVIGTSGDAASANTIYGAKAYADSLASNYDASGAASSAETAAKTYAKGLVDAILGEDSASTTLATLKAVIAELNDPANANGITGTFVDTVKADLAGLTKTVNNEEVHATVKEYVDNAVAAASGNASSAIAALDSTPSQTAGADGLALSLTQVDGVVTAISGSIAANTYDSYGSASTVQSTVIGTSGDGASANTIYGAKAYADDAIANQTQSSVVDHVLILGL